MRGVARWWKAIWSVDKCTRADCMRQTNLLENNRMAHNTWNFICHFSNWNQLIYSPNHTRNSTRHIIIINMAAQASLFLLLQFTFIFLLIVYRVSGFYQCRNQTDLTTGLNVSVEHRVGATEPAITSTVFGRCQWTFGFTMTTTSDIKCLFARNRFDFPSQMHNQHKHKAFYDFREIELISFYPKNKIHIQTQAQLTNDLCSVPKIRFSNDNVNYRKKTWQFYAFCGSLLYFSAAFLPNHWFKLIRVGAYFVLFRARSASRSVCVPDVISWMNFKLIKINVQSQQTKMTACWLFRSMFSIQ